MRSFLRECKDDPGGCLQLGFIILFGLAVIALGVTWAFTCIPLYFQPWVNAPLICVGK